jgi:hypothetical protein
MREIVSIFGAKFLIKKHHLFGPKVEMYAIELRLILVLAAIVKKLRHYK